MQLATSSSTPSSKRSKHEIAGMVVARLTLIVSGGAALLSLMLASMHAHALNAPILNNLNNVRNIAWGPTAKTSIGEIVASIILVFIGLLGVVFVVLLIYGGYMWLTAQGEETKTKKSQGLIFNAIIGLLIILSAYAIAYFVLRKLAGVF